MSSTPIPPVPRTMWQSAVEMRCFEDGRDASAVATFPQGSNRSASRENDRRADICLGNRDVDTPTYVDAHGPPYAHERAAREDTYGILVLRLDGIGDVVLTGPLLRGLRRTFPAARISCVVAPHALNLLEMCPYIDRVLTFPLSPASRWWHPVTRRVAALYSLAAISGHRASTSQSPLAGEWIAMKPPCSPI